MRRIKTLKDVVDFGLCIGCGACYYACDRGAVSLVNLETVGVRPRFENDACLSCTQCLSFCPGYEVDGDLMMEGRPKTTRGDHEFGQALEIWQGYASDPEIRYRASSGGLLTAISLYCLEEMGMKSVVHSGMDEDRPWLNKTQVSANREDLMKRTGSRYATSSPCDGLEEIEKSSGPCVFVGKPCDAAAVCKLAMEKPELDRNLGVVLSFFCAGTPSTRGTLELLEGLDIRREEIDELRYRGDGWPGGFKVLFDERMNEKFISYEESWGRLNKHRPLRCTLCPHGLGRVADLSCGDAWNDFDESRQDDGQSIVIVRTQRGLEILHGAMEKGYVTLWEIKAEEVIKAQPLLTRRRDLLGRLLGLKLLGLPVPRYPNFSLFRAWRRLPLSRKLRITLGMMRRAVLRGLWRRQSYDFENVDPEVVGPPLWARGKKD